MSERRTRPDVFEERLLDRLKAVVAERGAAAADADPAAVPASPAPKGRRPLRLALACAAVVVAAVVVLLVTSGGSDNSKAFAVETQAGGGLTIKIYSLEDTAGLEGALKSAGIPSQVNWLPVGTTCRERHLTPATVRTSMGGRTGGFEIGGPTPALTIGVMSADQYRRLSRAFKRSARQSEIAGEKVRDTIPNVSFDPKSFRLGQSVVITGSPEPHGGDPEGSYRASVEVVEGALPACEPVPEAAGSIGAIDVPAGSEGSAGAEPSLPQPGQFLFTKTKVVQVQDWEPDGRGTGTKAHPRHFTSRVGGPGGHPALVPTTKEVWTALDGKTRVRETLGQIEFLSAADQRRWEEAGSPPPFEYDPAEHHIKQDGAGNAMKEYASRSWRGRHVFSAVPKLDKLPTEAEALRLAIEHQEPGSPPSSIDSRNGAATAERLLEILSEPVTSPALRAAAFGALGELPGIGHEADATDVAGRHGEGLTWEDESGFGREVIFDPSTSRTLAEAEMVFGLPSTHNYGVPAGTVFRETAYLGSRIVDGD